MQGCGAKLTHKPDPSAATSSRREQRNEQRKQPSGKGRNRSRDSRATSDKSSKSADANDALIPLLQARMEEMQDLFPDLADSLKKHLAAPPAPAETLHDAQTACQIAFREMQVMENDVAELEASTADLVQQLRTSITDLADKQVELSISRENYDKAARIAQLQVQKSRPAPDAKSEAEHVQHLMRELSPEQLEQVAISLAAAAKEARENQTHVEEISPDPTTQAMETDGAAAAATAAAAAFGAPPPGPVAAGIAESGLPHGNPPPSVPLGHTAAPPPDIPVPGGTESGGTARREGSRSPRREPSFTVGGKEIPGSPVSEELPGEMPKPEEVVDLDDKTDLDRLDLPDKKSSAPESASKAGVKTARIGVADDAGTARTRSQSVASAASAAAGHDASHYAAIASTLGGEFAKVKTITPSTGAPGDATP